MGPYCNFCDRRCFIPITEKLWQEMTEPMRELYRKHKPVDIIATCSGGQEFEKERIGVCVSDIRRVQNMRLHIGAFFAALAMWVEDQQPARLEAIEREFERLTKAELLQRYTQFDPTHRCEMSDSKSLIITTFIWAIRLAENEERDKLGLARDETERIPHIQQALFELKNNHNIHISDNTRDLETLQTYMATQGIEMDELDISRCYDKIVESKKLSSLHLGQ